MRHKVLSTVSDRNMVTMDSNETANDPSIERLWQVPLVIPLALCYKIAEALINECCTHVEKFDIWTDAQSLNRSIVRSV